jgi:hypothetical protein
MHRIVTATLSVVDASDFDGHQNEEDKTKEVSLFSLVLVMIKT